MTPDYEISTGQNKYIVLTKYWTYPGFNDTLSHFINEAKQFYHVLLFLPKNQV